MSAKAIDYRTRLSDFMTEHVFGAEADYDDYRRAAGPADHTAPPIIEELKPRPKTAACGTYSCRPSRD